MGVKGAVPGERVDARVVGRRRGRKGRGQDKGRQKQQGNDETVKNRQQAGRLAGFQHAQLLNSFYLHRRLEQQTSPQHGSMDEGVE